MARRGAGRAGERARGRTRRRAGVRGAQTAAREAGVGVGARGAGHERVEREAWVRGARGVGARGARRGRAGRTAWACLCAQAGRAGWSAGLVLVHSAPGSVLTQFSVPFDSVFS